MKVVENISNDTKQAVILCGGRGSRMGKITQDIPKPLVPVHGKPILWYTILTLYKQGIRRMIFPLGYKGEMIEEYVKETFSHLNCDMIFVDTGEDASIGERIAGVKSLMQEDSDFFLLNSDTIFDMDVMRMYRQHKRDNALVTLSSVEVVSTYGLIVEKGGKLVDFARERKMRHIAFGDDPDLKGYINSGFAWLNMEALNYLDVEFDGNFEHDLYKKLIDMERASHYIIKGYWYAIDTPKEMKIINMESRSLNDYGERAKALQQEFLMTNGDLVDECAKPEKNDCDDISSRYDYAKNFIPDVGEMKRQILDKTYIPAQVEIQPGPAHGNLCWFKCPYCYGSYSGDKGDRLTRERFVEIMQQIADGGVKKVVWAGFTTDPLNNDYVEDLLQVAVDNQQLFGFHTKGFRVSDRFVDLVSKPSIIEKSYFSMSVDSGCNETYARLRGLAGHKGKMYDQVLNNMTRLNAARKQSGAPLELFATYLVNNYNSSEDEIRTFIRQFREAGVDLMRFSFPQYPRGATIETDAVVPDFETIQKYVERVTPIVEEEDSPDCRVILVDYDGDNDMYRKSRTLPCFARYIYPTVGFDGYLGNCSDSSIPNYREMALGNLADNDFWDLYYDYNSEDLAKQLTDSAAEMNRLGCNCDRKEHLVNARVIESGHFDEFI